MKDCKCGGKLEVTELTDLRQKWSCNLCGRYEFTQRDSNSVLDSPYHHRREHGHTQRDSLFSIASLRCQQA
jgi:hypothetical protein